jgi:hypothetical protein
MIQGIKAIDWFISPAYAHGLTTGNPASGFGPLIFIPAIIAFVLFVYFMNNNSKK